MTSPVLDAAVYEVSFDAQMPGSPDEFRIDVTGLNMRFPYPVFAENGDINGVSDDDGDGVVNGYGDNNSLIFVLPPVIENLDDLNNVSSLVAEIVSTPYGEVDANAAIEVAFSAGAGDNGFDLAFLSLPESFSSVSNFKLTRKIGAGNLVQYSDYKVDLSQAAKIKVEFLSMQTVSAIYRASLTAILPGKPAESVIRITLDYSRFPKGVQAVPGDVLSGLGDSQLRYTVRPKVVVVDTPIIAAKTVSGRISPTSVDVKATTEYTVNLLADFNANDNGFDIVRIEMGEGFEGPKNISISTATQSDLLGDLANRNNSNYYTSLLKVLDYSVESDVRGVSIKFANKVRINKTDLRIKFKSQAPDKPGVGKVTLKVANSRNLAFLEAKTDTSELGGSPGKQQVVVKPAQKTTAELAVAPVLPVSKLVAEVSPNSVVASTLQSVSLLVRATSDSGSGGFDTLKVSLPSDFAEVSGITLNYATEAGIFKLFQKVTDYSFVQNEGSIVFTLKPSVFASGKVQVTGGNTISRLAVSLSATMPAVPGSREFSVGVDNSKRSFYIRAVPGDVDGNLIGSLALDIIPDLAAYDVNQVLVDSPRAEISRASYLRNTQDTLDLYLAANVATNGIGFDMIIVDLPSDFDNIGNLKVMTEQGDGTVISTLIELVDYRVEVDSRKRNVKILLTNAAYLEGGAAPVYHISLDAKMPVFEGSYGIGVELVNTVASLGLAAQGGDASSSSIMNNLAVNIVNEMSSSIVESKHGYFGDVAIPTEASITSFGGYVRIWDGVQYTTEVTNTGAPSNDILFITYPVFHTTDAGIDYLNVDLPEGSGKASNFVVYLRNSTDQGLRYLQEFYDYTVDVEKTGRVVLKFQDEDGYSKPLDYTAMDNVDQMLIGFSLPLPKRNGNYFFDIWTD
ncbi:MAG: hypothetical protein HQL31_06760, partial [Planctomycetes bacterium]|nr:hypothetical protein [Planctomycetota bacterium]